MRWMTPEEALTVQGFPVRASQSFGRPCCSFAHRHQLAGGDHGGPSRQNIFKMSGNSMHVNVIGVVMLFAFTQIEIDPYLLPMLKEAARRQRDPRRLKQPGP